MSAARRVRVEEMQPASQCVHVLSSEPDRRSAGQVRGHKASVESRELAVRRRSPLRVVEPCRRPISYRQWFREKILPSRAMTAFTAFYIHWLLLFLMSAVLLPVPAIFEQLAMSASFSEDSEWPDEYAEPLDSRIQLEELEQSAIEVVPAMMAESVSATTQPITIEAPLDDILPEAVAALGLKDGKDEDDQPRRNKAMGLVKGVDVPHHAITAGSFSVWTEPANPEPGEAYSIFVQVLLPEGTDSYSVNDLDGFVVGSDGYQKKLPGAVRGQLPVVENTATLELPIVSADAMVEDVVFVRSKLLGESQKIRIVF